MKPLPIPDHPLELIHTVVAQILAHGRSMRLKTDSYTSSACVYRTKDNTKGCAVGMFLSDSACEALDSEPDPCLDNLWGLEPEPRNDHLQPLTKHSVQLWGALQEFHDSKVMWTESDGRITLSDLGQIRLNSIRNQYAQDLLD